MGAIRSVDKWNQLLAEHLCKRHRVATEEGLLKEGDIVLMISAGIGYAWDCLVMRWGPRLATTESEAAA